MVTALSPCWYRSGLVRRFGVFRMVIGEAVTIRGGGDWPADHGVETVLLDDPERAAMTRGFAARHPQLRS